MRRPEDESLDANYQQQQQQPNPGYVRHGKNIPNQVDRIIWAGQLEAKASKHLRMAETMLLDLDGFTKLKQVFLGLVVSFSNQGKMLFTASNSAISCILPWSIVVT